MRFFILNVIFFASIICNGQNKHIENLKNSNFFFLNELSKNKDLDQTINQNSVFNTIKTNKLSHIHSLLDKQVKQASQDIVSSYLFSANEIDSISSEFIVLNANDKNFNLFFKKLKQSNKYVNFHEQDQDDFIKRVVELNFKGLNFTLQVYGQGEKPNYPNIDSLSYNIDSQYFNSAIFFWAKHLVEQGNYHQGNFYQPMLDYGLFLMYMNHRDEPVRYEPLDTLYNSKAIEFARKVDFKKFPYNAIIVLGDGPENYNDPLAALGKLNLKIAVEQYKQKKAPFIIVSGGHVHPNRTKSCEAIEMKKELISVYNIPEKAIIVEPYARHTTTNLRNSTRLMLNYGFDISQKSMIVSYELHIKSIDNNSFNERFLRELGYLPGKITKIENQYLLDFYPSYKMKHINPFEPLDP